MNQRRKFWIPTVIELFGIFIIACGIGIEISMRADTGYLLISLGSGLVAFGGILYAKFKPWLER